MLLKNNFITLNLPENLKDFKNYREDPFIIFEQDNLLNINAYKKLIDEIHGLEKFNFIAVGGKKAREIGGHNLKSLKNNTFKSLCEILLSKAFYSWFVRTHLPYFKKNKIKIYIYNQNNIFFRICRKIRNLLNLPISFYITFIEYSSITKGNFIPPHTDVKQKRLSFVYYLPEKSKRLSEKMKNDLGTRFWKLKINAKTNLNTFNSNLLDEEVSKIFFDNYEEFLIACFERNKMVGFIKNDISWHTVKTNNYDYDRRAIVVNVFEIY